jgi:phospholipase/carboxylesterase
LLFHGVGGLPQDLRGLGEQLAQAFPQAAIVGVPGAFAGDMGQGRQWFSVQGIDEANRPARVAEALPLFLDEVRRWQMRTGVGPAATALVGFSQGAIMALEASKQAELLAARVVAVAGRYAVLPAQLHVHCTVHLIHGKHDEVMPYGLTVMAAKHLVAIGADVTADVLPFVRHEIPPEVCDLVLERLQGHIPQARWREAMAAAQGQRLD